jgi:hypothetical protein
MNVLDALETQERLNNLIQNLANEENDDVDVEAIEDTLVRQSDNGADQVSWFHAMCTSRFGGFLLG